MGTISEKLVYLNGTKQAIKQAINEDFEVIDDNTTFREYADEISSNNAKYKDLIPKETKNATNTLDISNSSGLDKALVTQYGNTHQEGEPTPDTPQDIHVVSGDNTIIISNSDNTQSASYPINLPVENLFDKDNANIINGYVSAGSNNILSTSNGKILYLSCKKNKIYSIQKQIASGTDNFYVFTTTAIPEAGISIQNLVNASGQNSCVYTTNNTAIYLCVYFLNVATSTTSLETMLSTIQIEKGPKANQYTPYGTTPIELCKIDTYKDRIYPLNGKWYLHKEIGKVVFNGSESWYYDTSGNRFARGISNSKTEKQRFPIVSNYFKYISSGGENGGGFNFGGSIYLYNYDCTSTNEFQTWLSTHNTEVYYVLATPTTEEITESNYPTLYNQLNNIKLFEGVNHITMTNESGLDVEFDIEYYKDWKLD